MIALNGVVGALQLHQPHATHVNQHYHENGWTPKPTAKPKPMIELFKRQDDFEFCGYLTGDGGPSITKLFFTSLHVLTDTRSTRHLRLWQQLHVQRRLQLVWMLHGYRNHRLRRCRHGVRAKKRH